MQHAISDAPTVEIVIPICNEQEYIHRLLAKLFAQLEQCKVSFQILFVDDGSRDKSWELILNACEQYSHVNAIRFFRNFGKEAAIRAGLEHSSADAIIVMDADLQHPPELIPQMIELWKKGDVLVVEAKKQAERRAIPIKQWGAHATYRFMQFTTGFVFEGQSDYKLLDRRVVDFLCELPEHVRFFRGLVSWLGVPSAEISFEVPERITGKTRWTLRKLLTLALDIVTSFTSFPLRMVTMFSALFILFSILLGIQTIFQYFFRGAVEGFTTVIICILLVGGVLAGGLGIMGEYLARVYEEIKARPSYLVREYGGSLRSPKDSHH